MMTTIPFGYCQCGCGQKTNVAPQSCVKHGVRYAKGESFRFVTGHHARLTPEEYFWSHVNKGDPDTCWNWQAGLNPNGYGHFSVKSKQVSAHRFSYALAHGAILKGMSVLHTCDNRRCVNPSHLYAGTAKENRRDAVERNRLNPVRGELRSKQFTESDVLAMRADWRTGKYTLEELGIRYNAPRTTVSAIVHYHNWKHVP